MPYELILSAAEKARLDEKKRTDIRHFLVWYSSNRDKTKADWDAEIDRRVVAWMINVEPGGNA
jgi:hypothetical protein